MELQIYGKHLPGPTDLLSLFVETGFCHLLALWLKLQVGAAQYPATTRAAGLLNLVEPLPPGLRRDWLLPLTDPSHFAVPPP